MAKALIEADKTLKALEAENARLEPKAKSFDHFLATGKDLSVKQAAQMLCRAGLETGQNRLFKTLDALGWVYKPAGRKSWSVYQKVIDAGHMAVIASTWEDPATGERFVTTTPRITAKSLYRLWVAVGRRNCARFPAHRKNAGMVTPRKMLLGRKRRHSRPRPGTRNPKILRANPRLLRWSCHGKSNAARNQQATF